MGKLPDCEICKRPVLSLEGQAEHLVPYFANSKDDPDAFDLVGDVHTKCLLESPHGRRWTTWRMEHFTGRGYQVVGVADGWTALGTPHTRDRYALHELGASVGLEPEAKLGRIRDGVARTRVIKKETHITIVDREFVADVHARLVVEKELPLALLIDQLGIRNDLYWPGVLDNARWVFSRQLRRAWVATSVSAEIHYDVGVPQVVAELWAAAGL